MIKNNIKYEHPCVQGHDCREQRIRKQLCRYPFAITYHIRFAPEKHETNTAVRCLFQSHNRIKQKRITQSVDPFAGSWYTFAILDFQLATREGFCENKTH